MTVSAMPVGPNLKKTLHQLGVQIRARRKSLGVTAVAAAEAADISRVTLHRIERGEASVSMGAYLNVIRVLGLTLGLSDTKSSQKASPPQPHEEILLADYPQLRRLAWNLKGKKKLSLKEALNLYERNWRHVDLKEMDTKERELIQRLLTLAGRERLLV